MIAPDYFGPLGNGELLDITPEQYHRDPCKEPSLSSSCAKQMVDESPLHAMTAHPRFGGAGSESTDAQDEGSIFHSLVLGKGTQAAVIPAESFRTKAAQAERDAAAASGRIPILKHKYEVLVEMADRTRERLADFGVRFNGRSELAVTWRERVHCSDATVQCRAMFDHVVLNDGVIFDLKKARDAHPDKCSRSISEYGYDIQWAAYTSAMRALRPELAGKEEMIFLFCEPAAPYDVTPVRLGGEFRALGEFRWRRAVSLWHQCTTTGRWPGYTDRPVEASPPTWALMKAQFEGMVIQ